MLGKIICFINLLAQNATSLNNRAYCYIELVISSLVMTVSNHHWASLCLPNELSWPEFQGVSTKKDSLPAVTHLSTKAQIPIRRLCDKVRDKFATKSQTHIMKVRDTNHVADFHDLCPRTCRGLCRRLSPCIVTS